MGETTKIEWCHHTFNPWIGCVEVAPECGRCYARELMAVRWKRVEWGKNAERKKTATWRDPVKWNKAAEKARERRRVFCASLSDIFEDKPELTPWRRELFLLIDDTPWLDWLLLTKRPENILRMWPIQFPKRINGRPQAATRMTKRKNVWLGTSCGHPESVHRVRSLVECRELSPILFVSAEPLLQPLHFGSLVKGVDWVIVGGESGKGARPCETYWIRSIMRQCNGAGVPVFVKQMGSVVRTGYYESHEQHREHAFNRMVREIGVDPGIQPDGAALIEWKPVDTKGGDPSEWPADLRVREFPEVGR